MKTLKKGVCLFLVLAAQVFAQRFTASVPDIVATGYYSSSPSLIDTGYHSASKQIAALGEKKSSYSNIMLLGGRDTMLVNGQEKLGTYKVVSSNGHILGTVYPLSGQNNFTLNGKAVKDNNIPAVLVLDSLSDSKKTATVIFAGYKKLVVMKITVNNMNSMDFDILKSIDLPDAIWNNDGTYASIVSARRLVLLGIDQNGGNKIYNLATSNAFNKGGTSANSGRVDFFSIIENSWTFWQPNTTGLAHGINGLSLGDNIQFGTDLAVINNFDKKGGKALAVLLPYSTQHPKSAVYIFSMENDWSPNTNIPKIITGDSKPWFEYAKETQDCKGLSVANWEDGNPHLLVSCNVYQSIDASTSSRSIIIKDIVLDSDAKILQASDFFYKHAGTGEYLSYYTNSNPLPINNAVALTVNGPSSSLYSTLSGAFYTISVIDANHSKNFSISAGAQEKIVNIDSLFYRNGATGFSVKTLFGIAQCSVNSSKELLCQASKEAIGSWSSIELSSIGACSEYVPCKTKDTIFIYVRSPDESSNTALRIPKNIVVPNPGQVDLNSILQNTNINLNTNNLKLCAVTSNNFITPFSQKEGIDTLILNNYLAYLHIADTSKILSNAIPATPGSDTVWNTAVKKYIALPNSNSKGDAYTYDIVQDSLKNYAEIIGNYLHILKVDFAEIFVAYTENGQIKYRKIVLMPEGNPAESNPIAQSSFAQNFKATHINGNVQITGFYGELELYAYNFKGEMLQKEKIYSQGFVSVKLRQNCPQIVQIKTTKKILYISALWSIPVN